MKKIWSVKENKFVEDNITNNGNKFLIGSGFMGYRGTLEEYRKEQLVALNLPGVYDQFKDKWRESVNAPNPLYTRVLYKGIELNPIKIEPVSHEQVLDISCGLHSRKTTLIINQKRITVEAERFISQVYSSLMVMKYSVTADDDIEIKIETGIDGDIWDINGPHLEPYDISTKNNIFSFFTKTRERQIPLAVSETICYDFDADKKIIKSDDRVLRQLSVKLKKGKKYTFYKFSSVKHSSEKVLDKSLAEIDKAFHLGYQALYDENLNAWENKWNLADVVIKGDNKAQFALRYSIYHLLILTPKSEYASIPARGISGQVYKGAVFWDTEVYMLPFYLATDPEAAKNIIKYRINTLEGAKRKAKEYGYRGAFYAWESQETGDDACTHFNVTDVFTNRPIRTYFRDKQIHISADIVYAIWQVYLRTGDDSLLLEGAAEVILECARFYYSYGFYNLDKKRFEILDVTGPDEYHERVNNNAFTNRMVLETFNIMLKVVRYLEDKYPNKYKKLIDKLDYKDDLENIKNIKDDLYLQQPDKNGIIEQFDGYFKLEDTTIEEVRSRLVHPNEYWGGGNGVATNTQVIKQADVVTMLYMFKNEFSEQIKRANWKYYEPRTEHGSSLSACMYALLACEIGMSDWAYPYFMKTASVDLTGKTKQYAGGIYIGGTHPAASGGAYMTAVFGFAGLKIEQNNVAVTPRLPEKWEGMTFKILLNEDIYKIDITYDQVNITKEVK
jgi:trehalose/maltose hydrolase-like predicted phosphorylase